MKKTLAEVLQIKKDLEEKASSLERKLRTENSIIVGNTRSTDLNAVYQEWLNTLDERAKIKELLQKANLPIYSKIFEHDKLAAKKKLFESMKVFEGKKVIPTAQGKKEVIEMEAVFSKAFVASEITKIDTQIKKIRDELTDFNNNTEIEL